ncbi:hypothetical protein TNCV_4571071 [Trichonephila clavipes]|nr:hypothetical protein TNCV_4571071 [Trichonephila clavipes]
MIVRLPQAVDALWSAAAGVLSASPVTVGRLLHRVLRARVPLYGIPFAVQTQADGCVCNGLTSTGKPGQS